MLKRYRNHYYLSKKCYFELYTRVLPINYLVELYFYIPRKLNMDFASVTYTSHPVNCEIQSIFAKYEYKLLLLNLLDKCSEFEQKKITRNYFGIKQVNWFLFFFPRRIKMSTFRPCSFSSFVDTVIFWILSKFLAKCPKNFKQFRQDVQKNLNGSY